MGRTGLADMTGEHGGEQTNTLKGVVRVRSPNTREQCSLMFVFVRLFAYAKWNV
jgi:hypothetical protein